MPRASAVARADAAGVPARLAGGRARRGDGDGDRRRCAGRGARPAGPGHGERRRSTSRSRPPPDLALAEAWLASHARGPECGFRWALGYDIHRRRPGPAAGAGRRDASRATGASKGTATPTCCRTRSATRCSARSRSATSGKHFPPGDPRWKDVSSLDLLRLIRALLDGAARDDRQRRRDGGGRGAEAGAASATRCRRTSRARCRSRRPRGVGQGDHQRDARRGRPRRGHGGDGGRDGGAAMSVVPAHAVRATRGGAR